MKEINEMSLKECFELQKQLGKNIEKRVQMGGNIRKRGEEKAEEMKTELEVLEQFRQLGYKMQHIPMEGYETWIIFKKRS